MISFTVRSCRVLVTTRRETGLPFLPSLGMVVDWR